MIRIPRIERSTTVVALAALSLLLSPTEAEDRLQFNRDIRRILSDNCFACHGPDAAQRKSSLRLDQRPSAIQHSALVPAQADKSQLITRIYSDDSDYVMPPLSSPKQLTSDEKALLRRWIEEGAEYERHWSFITPKLPAVPAVQRSDWSRNAIDRFIVRRLEHEGIDPSAKASREMLIRRVTLDLTGLPPTPKQTRDFLSDDSAAAYDRLVDRLMSSRSYAERRAQDWLDLARYADTRGWADDQKRDIWPWRDWVINAIARNMPFDKFTIEQLAGDMLPNPTPEQRLGSAFHRNAPQARGVSYPVEEYRLKGVFDRVNTTGTVWLGLTVECSKCHDHKFDPISQVEYYRLMAFFNNIEHSPSNGGTGPHMDYLSPALRKQRAEIQQELDVALAQVPKNLAASNDEHLVGKWNSTVVESDPSSFALTGGFTITATIRTKKPIGDIASKYDWRSKQRSYVFGIGGEGESYAPPGHLFAWISAKTEPFEGVEIYGSRTVNDGREHHVAVAFEPGSSVKLYVDGIHDTAATIKGTIPTSVAISDRRLSIGSGYNQSRAPNSYRFDGQLDDVRFYDRALPDPLGLGEFADETVGYQVRLADIYKHRVSVPVMKELPKPRDTFVHVRGSFLNQGPRVEPGVPAILGIADEAQPRDRLALARWLVSGKHPLVARVAVNRFWQSYFGHGLSRTPDDFGAQGQWPSHPELLDWLACYFVDSGWNMKAVHRLIVTSATYRQSSRTTPELLARDPENRLLARMPRVRLPAEQIRDQALSVAGLLSSTIGGPSVFPIQPDGYWQTRALPGEWTPSQGERRFRRSIYTYWRRMALHPTLEMLDAPSRASCTAQRTTANLPTQALVTLNGPMFVEASQALARRVLRAKSTDEDRLTLIFELCLSRSPALDERYRFLDLLRSQASSYQSALDRAEEVVGERDASLAAWSSIASVMLNLDETLNSP